MRRNLVWLATILAMIAVLVVHTEGPSPSLARPPRQGEILVYRILPIYYWYQR